MGKIQRGIEIFKMAREFVRRGKGDATKKLARTPDERGTDQVLERAASSGSMKKFMDVARAHNIRKDTKIIKDHVDVERDFRGVNAKEGKRLGVSDDMQELKEDIKGQVKVLGGSKKVRKQIKALKIGEKALNN